MAGLSIKSMLADSHIHIGPWYDYYLTAERLSRFTKRQGITSIALSSTSVCCENYSAALNEMKTAIDILDSNVAPVLWITASMIESKAVHLFLDSGINWKCTKIHPKLDKDYWLKKDNQKFLLNTASYLHCPILIHTGELDYCYPLEYENFIRENYNQKFILAHGRPLCQVAPILETCPNAYVDTAFMPINDIIQISSLGLSDRILWGSDYPIELFGTNALAYDVKYKFRLAQLKVSLPKDAYKQITNTNFNTLFYGKPS